MYISSRPYPYLPQDRTIEYVSEDNPFMARARELCVTHTRFCKQPTAAVIVKNGTIIGEGKNGGENPPAVCVRVLRGSKTGEDYDLCPGCDPQNHAEPTALRNAISPSPNRVYNSRELYTSSKEKETDLYLYGHWWCCELCWNIMIAHGIQNVFLVEGATEKFG